MPEKELKEIHELVASGLMSEGERRLRILFDSVNPRDLKAFEPKIEAVIALFSLSVAETSHVRSAHG